MKIIILMLAHRAAPFVAVALLALALFGCAAPRGDCPSWHVTCGFD